jgi:Mrp family chromosome partitioning ATPase
MTATARATEHAIAAAAPLDGAPREVAEISASLASLVPMLAHPDPAEPSTRAIVLTSCHHGEGTTTVAINLAAALSRHGARVLLVEANFRTPSMPDASAPARTLAEYLFGDATIDGIVRQAAPTFHVVAAGSVAGDVDLPRMAARTNDLLRRVVPAYDCVILDAAPFVAYPETTTLARQVGRVGLVIEAERTRWEVAREATEALDRQGVTTLGVILNRKRRYIPGFMYRAL